MHAICNLIRNAVQIMENDINVNSTLGCYT